MIEYNSRLNNFFGVRVVPLLMQITAPIKQEKNFSIDLSGKFYELSPICEKCGCTYIDHNGNDLYKSRLLRELGIVIKRGKFVCKKCGHTWTTRCKDVELFVQQYKEIVRIEIFNLCTFDVSLDNITAHIHKMFDKKISHEWVRQIYLESARKIQETKVLSSSGIFNYDEQHPKVNGKTCFRVVVIDAVTKDVIFDETVEDKKIETLKDKLNIKLIPYKKEAFIVDLAMGYPQMLKDLFPDVKVQWCIFHLNQLVVGDFEKEKKLNRYGKKVLPLQQMYNLYKVLNIFFEHSVECSFLKRQLNKLTNRREMLKGCSCYESDKEIIPGYEMRLISEFLEFRKSLKKHRRKYPYKYLIRRNKAETINVLEELKNEIGLYPKQVQKRIKKIIENLDKLTVFQGNPLVPPTNNNIEQYYSATLQKTEKKRFRCKESLFLKLKIVREEWNGNIGNLRFQFMNFLQLCAKIFYLFVGT